MQSKYLHAGMQLQAGLVSTVHNTMCGFLTGMILSLIVQLQDHFEITGEEG